MKFIGIFAVVLCLALGLTHGAIDEVRSAFSLSFSLFQAFADVYNVQIGYPMVNKYGSICQTPPYTYAHIPFGAVMDITGTLRNSTGHVVGLWYSPKNCYVKPYSQTDDCVEFNFSNRVSECDNDSRLQLNAANQGFSLIKRLNDVQAYIDVFSTKIGQMSILVEQLGVLTDATKQAAFIAEIVERDPLLDVNFRAYLELISTHLTNDIPNLLDSIQQLDATDDNIENDQMHFRNISDTYNIVNDLQSFEKYTDVEFFALQDSVIENFASVVTNYNDILSKLQSQNRNIPAAEKRIVLARTKLIMKHAAYSINLLSTTGFVMRVKKMKSWSQGCRVPSCGIYTNSVGLKVDAVARVFNQIDLSPVSNWFDTCLPSVVQDVGPLIDTSTVNLIRYNIPFQWHTCIISQDLPLSRVFYLDFSHVSQQFTITGTVSSEEGYSGTSFLPRTIFSRSAIIDNRPVRILDLGEYFKPPLQESNYMLVELVYLPPPPPGPIPPASGSPRFKCPPGRYGQLCQPSPIGTWSNDGYLHICSNGPEQLAQYFMMQWPTPDCPFKCLNELYRVNNTCSQPQIGYYPLDGSEQLGRCRTEYDTRFISFTTSGKISQPFSCGITVHHGLEMQYNLSLVLEDSFTIDLWAQLDLNQVHDISANSNNIAIALGLLDIPNVWSWHLVVNQSRWALLEVRDGSSESVASSEFLIDGSWHQYTLIYDARLRLISFVKDSILIGTAWFALSSEKQATDLLIIGGVHKNDASMNPWQYRVFRGSIALVSVYNVAFSLEALATDISSAEKSCPVSQIWNNHKCGALCDVGSSPESDGSCSCYWGKYLNGKKECVWCSGSTVGSKFPFKNESDCICQSGYIWSESETRCIVGQPSPIAPNVTFVFNNAPLSQSEVSSLNSDIPLNSTIAVQIPDHWQTRNVRSLLGGNEDVILSILIVSGLDILVDQQISFGLLPYTFLFDRIGQYRIDAAFSKPGHLPGIKYSRIVQVKQQARGPFVYPLNRELGGKTLLRMATTEILENQIIYSLDNSAIQIFDNLNPPVILPPVTLVFFVKPKSEDVLPSAEQIVSFVWNKSSDGYIQYMIHQNVGQIPTSNVTEVSTPPVIGFVFWCQKNVPNCILAFVMPVVGISLFVIVIIFIVIIIRIIVKRRELRRQLQIDKQQKQHCKKRSIAIPPPPPSENLAIVHSDAHERRVLSIPHNINSYTLGTQTPSPLRNSLRRSLPTPVKPPS